jgi:hypothetical protein
MTDYLRMIEIKSIKLQLLKDYPDLTPRVIEFFDYYIETNKESLYQVYDAGREVGNTAMHERLKSVLEDFINQDKLIEQRIAAEKAEKALLKAQEFAHERNLTIVVVVICAIVLVGITCLFPSSL